MRKIRVAAAQMGFIPGSVVGNIHAQRLNEDLINGDAVQKSKARNILANLDVDLIREYNLERIQTMLKTAARHGSELVVFPELCLTSFFPYFWIEDLKVLSHFFEQDDTWKSKIRDYAKSLEIKVAFGYSQSTPEKANLFELFTPDIKDKSFVYQKVHIPGFDEPRLGEKTFQFEKKYFAHGREYPVWDVLFNNDVTAKVGLIICHDRRYNNPYLMMGLKKVELILNGYNTPFYLTFNNKLDGDVYKFHYFPLQAQAITEGTFIVSVARAGTIFGRKQIAGTCIISPDGEIMAKTEKLGEDIIYAELDLDWCKIVRDQKYQGERSQPEVLYKELEKYMRVKKGTNE